MTSTIIITVITTLGFIAILEFNRRMNILQCNNKNLQQEITKTRKLLAFKYSHVRTHLTKEDLNELNMALRYYSILISDMSTYSNIFLTVQNELTDQLSKVQSMVDDLVTYHSEECYLLSGDKFSSIKNNLELMVTNPSITLTQMSYVANECLEMMKDIEHSDNSMNVDIDEILRQRDEAIDSLNKEETDENN